MELTHSQTASAVPSHKNTLRPAAFRNIRGGSGSIFKETGIMSSLTPRQIVAELDKYIIGQEQAKRMVAVAVRNRWRRQQLAPELRDEIAPKNIILMGPTGVGKTEIARRLARLTGAPFIKVEATKYTEVGYVGRDVESMIRDLMELGIKLVREEEHERVRAQAKEYGHSNRREMSYLVTHSVLHLLGYDHLDEGPMKRQMREREEAIMSLLGLER